MMVVQLWGINGGREYRESGYWDLRALGDDVEISGRGDGSLRVQGRKSLRGRKNSAPSAKSRCLQETR